MSTKEFMFTVKGPKGNEKDAFKCIFQKERGGGV